MCGRYTLTVNQLDEVVEALGVEVDEVYAGDYRPRYNVAPGDTCLVLRSKEGRTELLPAAWGLVNHWATDRSVGYRQINARAETLGERPAFREAFAKRRCVVPADGFYEWRGPRGAKEPLWFHRPGGGLLLFAGLHASWRNPADGALLRTFTIITTAANDVVAPVHDRMPAILPAESVASWLTGDEPGTWLGPAPEGTLAMRPASLRVNTVGNDDPGCLDAGDPLQPPRQMKLF